MLRVLSISCLCLSLLSCDKPDSPESSKESDNEGRTEPQRRYSTRETPTETSKRFRDLIVNAEKLDPEEREKALAAVAWSALELDPKIAVEAFEKMSSDRSEKFRLIHHYAMRLTAVNVDEAIEWAKSFESEMETSVAISSIAVAIAENEPERAANLLSDSAIAGRDLDVAVVQVIQRWASVSAVDAASWIALFPPGEARQAGIQVVSDRWLKTDAPAAFAWMENLRDAGLRAEAARAMQGVILQQPKAIRDGWLQHAGGQALRELETQREQALKDIGDNLVEPED